MMQMSEVEANLAAHLKDVRRKLSCSAITYVALIKDTHLLEVPEASPQICHSLPDQSSHFISKQACSCQEAVCMRTPMPQKPVNSPQEVAYPNVCASMR